MTFTRSTTARSTTPHSTNGRTAALLSVGVAAILGLVGAPVARADGPDELDRRATMALWNSFSMPGKVWTLEEVKPDTVNRLDLKPKPGARQYGTYFGAKEADGSGRGLHKITIGMPPKDSAADGWVKVSETADPATVGWKKLPGKTSEAEKYADFQVRGSVGGVVMIVMQRRPLGEIDASATAALLARYRVLLDAVKKAGLFARLKMTLFVGESDGEGTDITAGATPLISTSARGVILRLRLEMLDVEGRPIEPKWYSVALTGPLAKFATVTGAEHQPEKKRWFARDPGARRDLTIELPPSDAAIEAALYQHRVSGSSEPTLGFKVGSKQK